MNETDRRTLSESRFRRPSAVSEAAARRAPRGDWGGDRLLILAADHTARGVIDVGDDPVAMADRYDLLDRLCAALAVPGVDGVLGTPDVIEDLLLLGALDDKVVFGSMNRGGLSNSVFEYDDRFTGYSAASIVESGLEGGKMLLRVNLEDSATADTLSACAKAVTDLAAARKVAMVEPFMSRRQGERAVSDLSSQAIVRSMSIASALGATSAYTWLKIPVIDDMAPVVEATTLPLVLLGGARSDRPDEMFARWQRALELPGVRGLVVGRNLLYPRDGDVVAAVKTAASLL
ncbi:MAG TPA: deoxyribose-phosphate aldolase [Acidimicrobiales bacterium]|nr:deoxyribose-phosphate aldolase [Acidimicrobiales bacterium]